MNLAKYFFPLFLLFFNCKPATASEPAMSLQPLFTNSDCETFSDLLGDWDAQSDLWGTWTIQAHGKNSYRLVEKREKSDSTKRTAFNLCLAHIGNDLFFDATEDVLEGPDQTSVLGDDGDLIWLPLHLIGRLDIETDALHFRLLDDSWLQAELASGRLQLTHTQLAEGEFLVTAPPKELKSFALHYASDPDAFSLLEEFARNSDDVAAFCVPHPFARAERKLANLIVASENHHFFLSA
jgi:hypothetical protein